MGYDPSAPPCPRCGTLMPASARFCRNCGLTQEVAQDMLWRSSAPYGVVQPPDNGYAEPLADDEPPYAAPPGAPQYAPPADPFARSRRGPAQSAYPAVGFDPPPPKRHFWRSFWGLSVVGFLLLLVVGVGAFAMYFYPQLCSAQQRNNLRDDLPLPCGITFIDHLDRSASGTTGPGSEEWVYSVDGTSPAQIASFYQQNLPGKGWTLPASVQSSENNAVLACKAPTVALIHGSQQTNLDDGASPPQGGSLLIIILAPVKNLSPQIQQACAS